VFRLRLAGYLLRETAGLYLLGVAAFCLLLSIDTLTVWASYLIQQNATLGVIARLMLYQLPLFLHLSLPVAAVFAVLLATGRLAKDSELKAAYALGVPPLSLLWPLLGFGLLISGVALLNNGYLEPRGQIAEDELVASFFNARPSAETQRDVSFRQEGGLYYAARIRADTLDRTRAELSGVLVYGDDGTLYSAPYGTWDSEVNTWTLEEVEVLREGEAPRVEPTLTLPFTLQADAGASLSAAENLTLSELYARIEAGRRAGQSVRGDLFNLHRRLADASSAVIFVLIAGALGLHLRGRSAGFGWTIVLLVCFFALWTLAESFFEQGILSPVAAAWLTTGVVGLVGSALALVRLR
jgi:lipopolysaccharide export system permease protein